MELAGRRRQGLDERYGVGLYAPYGAVLTGQRAYTSSSNSRYVSALCIQDSDGNPVGYAEWRRPTHALPSQDYATYVKILTWFLDNPSPLCPFGVHRMAL